VSIPRVTDIDVLWLRRTDLEAVPDNDGRQAVAGTVVTDWLDPRPPVVRMMREAVQPLLLQHPRALRTLRRYSEATFDYQARTRMNFGCRLLGRGKVVITDRLHGHILSLLLGIPHVLLDNSYGKLRHFHETWTCSMPQVRWVESSAEARAVAEQLLT
jgi:pyruvyl transferase EpsO